MRMGPAGFLARLGGDDGCQGIRHQVCQLQRFHQVRVPYQAAVGHLDVLHPGRNRRHLRHTFGQRLVGAEHRRIRLHAPLHLQPQFGGGGLAVGVAQTVEPVQRLVDAGLVQHRIGRGRINDLAGLDRRRATEDHQVDQAVGPQTVRPVDRGAARLAHCHQTGKDRVGVAGPGVQHLAPIVGGDAAHVVMHRRQHRDRFLLQVNACENPGGFADARQAQVQRFLRQVVQVQVDVVLVRAHAAPFADFDGHAAADHIAAGQILVGGGIAFHEPLAFGIGQIAALAPRAFGDQAARAVDAGRVKLHEFHVLQRQARPRNHAAAIPGAGMGRGGAEIGAAIAARRQHRHLGVEHMDRAIIQLPGDDTLAMPLFGQDQINGEVFDEEFRVVLQALPVKRVQNGMARAVGGGTGALYRRSFTEFGGMAAEGALIDLAAFGTAERYAVMLQLVHRLGRFPRQIFHRVGVAQPVRPLDGVVHVPLPAVRAHVAQAGGDAALCRNRVRPGRENLCHAGGAQALLGHAQRCAQTRAASTHHHHIVIMRLVSVSH